MKKLLLASLLFTAATPAFATDAAKNYQVTGPVTELTDGKVTVQKGKETWEINRGSAELPADVKVGSKITVEYNMTATKITAKAAKGAAEKKPAAPAKTPDAKAGESASLETKGKTAKQ